MSNSKFSKDDSETTDEFLDKVNGLIEEADKIKNKLKSNRKAQVEKQKERLLGLLNDT